MNKQNDNISKETETIKMRQILALKSTITELKTSLEGFNSRHNQAEERIRTKYRSLKFLNQSSKKKKQ